MEAPTRDGLPLSTHYDQIKLWQERTGHDPEHQDQGVVSRLSRNCQNSLRHLIQHLDFASISTSERNPLRRSLASLKLWSDGHGATTGALDKMLDHSKNLHLTTLSVSIPTCKALSHVHVLPQSPNEVTVHLFITVTELYNQTRWLLTSRDDDTSNSDGDSDSDSDSSIFSGNDDSSKMHDLVQDIKTYTNSLIDLGMALTYPALEPEVDNVPNQIMSGQRSAHDYHTDLIMAKFPQAELLLLKILGRISWGRYLRMQQERDANAYKGHATISSNNSQPEFQHSGLGTSIPPQPSSYVESTLSFMTSVASGRRVWIPPLTVEAKSGTPFECNACGMSMRVTNNREWRNHVYTNLRPYTCLYTNCKYSVEPFVDRQRWSDHLELDHELEPRWNSLECPLCLENIESGKKGMLSHFARHLDDIAVASLPRDVESDAESDAGSSMNSALAGSSQIAILDREIELPTMKYICGLTAELVKFERLENLLIAQHEPHLVKEKRKQQDAKNAAAAASEVKEKSYEDKLTNPEELILAQKDEQLKKEAAVADAVDAEASVSNLGSLLSRQGKYEEVEAIHRQVLKGKDKIIWFCGNCEEGPFSSWNDIC